jgi:hypothetical protein
VSAAGLDDDLGRPGLGHFALDLAVGVFIAWLLPDGANLIIKPINQAWALSDTGLSDVEVAALATFVLFGLQSIAWVNRVAVATTANVRAELQEWTLTQLPDTVSSTLLNEMASHVLGRGPSEPGFARGLAQYTSYYAGLPLEARAAAPLLLSRELQAWADQCDRLRSTGIEISQEEQVALIAEVCRNSSSFMLIDPVLYDDIAHDWTTAWRTLVAGELARSGLRLDYVYVARDPGSRLSNREDRPSQRARLDALASFMVENGWAFHVCDERDVSAAGVPEEMYARLLEVFDETLMISMPMTRSFVTGALTLTRLSTVDDAHRRYIEAVAKYKRPYVPKRQLLDRWKRADGLGDRRR